MVKDEGAEPFSLFVFANGYQIYLQKVDMLMKHTPTNNFLIAADHYRPKLSIQHFVGDEFVFYAGEVGIEKAGEGQERLVEVIAVVDVENGIFMHQNLHYVLFYRELSFFASGHP